MKATNEQILKVYKKKELIPITPGKYPVEQYLQIFLDEGQKFAFIMELGDFYEKPKSHAISLLLKGGNDIIPDLYIEWIEQILKLNRSLAFYFIRYGLNIMLPLNITENEFENIQNNKLEFAKFDDFLKLKVESIEINKIGKILSRIRNIRNRYEHGMMVSKDGLVFKNYKKNDIKNDFKESFEKSKDLLSSLQKQYCIKFPKNQRIIPNLV